MDYKEISCKKEISIFLKLFIKCYNVSSIFLLQFVCISKRPSNSPHFKQYDIDLPLVSVGKILSIKI